MTTFVVAEIPTAHDTICSDCDGDWYLPAAAIGALAFFVLGYSVFNFSVGNWAQQFLEPSKTVFYTTIQPLFAALFSWVFAVGGAPGSENLALPGLNLLGVIGIMV